MNKALVLSLFLGLATAAYDQGWYWPNEDGSLEYVAQENYYGLGYLLHADAGYGTIYNVISKENEKTESYGLKAYAFGEARVKIEVGSVYHNLFKFNFMPVYIEPYT